jgi:hypothetical protein
MNEIVFLVQEDPEGGFTARALGSPIFTEADTFEDLKSQVRDALACHFGYGVAPSLVRLHLQKDEVILS